jgi:16S rRNA (guanine966-N2)-methyltransferase
LRVISGQWKGRNIIAPKNLPVRPTTDFAKTALFNILANHFDFEQVSVLDLFCGTGNISYEFVSRGTSTITCVDENTHCIKFVKDTFTKLDFRSAQTIKSEVFLFLNHCSEKFDIIFADPPFDMEETDTLPDLIFEKELLNKRGWLVIEHKAKRKLATNIRPHETRIYSNCAFSIYKYVT